MTQRMPAAAVIGLLLASGVAGCRMGGSAGGGTPQKPPGLTQEGPLDVGCKVTGAPGNSSFTATVTLWNPGSTPQSVSETEIYWTSNGVFLSEATPAVDTEVQPGTAYTGYMSLPLSATGCMVEGWNP